MNSPRRFHSIRQNFYITKKLNKAIEEVLECERRNGNEKIIKGGKSHLFRIAVKQLIYDYWNDKSDG